MQFNGYSLLQVSVVNTAWFAVSVQYEIHLIQGKSTVSNRKEIESNCNTFGKWNWKWNNTVQNSCEISGTLFKLLLNQVVWWGWDVIAKFEYSLKQLLHPVTKSLSTVSQAILYSKLVQLYTPNTSHFLCLHCFSILIIYLEHVSHCSLQWKLAKEIARWLT